MTSHHACYCLEYLRQPIVCNVDTYVEYYIFGEDGVRETPDWDVKRCRSSYAATYGRRRGELSMGNFERKA